MKHIYNYLFKHTPKEKSRSWALSLVWKTFKYFRKELNDISEVWHIYRVYKENSFKDLEHFYLSHKIELKPNNVQKTYFQKACGVSRFTWNWGLAKWKEQYKNGLKPTGRKLAKEFNSVKKEQFPFTYEVTKSASQQPFINLQSAYDKFFKKTGGFPKFKKKGKNRDSFFIGGDHIRIVNKKVRIPILGLVKMKENIRFEGKIFNATVSRIADKWFISFTIEPSLSYLPCKNQASVGIDLGIKSFATLSDNTYIENRKPLKNSLRKLKRENRKLSKKIKNSKNFQKQVKKVSKVHKRVADIRKDSIHKVTSYLTNSFEFIAIEDLNVSGLVKNRKLSKAISDVGFYEFRRQLEYKSKLKGNKLLIIDKWFPSSKNCSSCGTKKDDLKLSDRVYKCKKCGVEIDRDLNASINIHNQLPMAYREVKPVEIMALNLEDSLLDLTSIVEAGKKYQANKLV